MPVLSKHTLTIMTYLISFNGLSFPLIRAKYFLRLTKLYHHFSRKTRNFTSACMSQTYQQTNLPMYTSLHIYLLTPSTSWSCTHSHAASALELTESMPPLPEMNSFGTTPESGERTDCSWSTKISWYIVLCYIFLYSKLQLRYWKARNQPFWWHHVWYWRIGLQTVQPRHRA